MAAFSERADAIDEGVHVNALYLALLASILTITTALLAGRAQPTGQPVAHELDPQR